MHARLLELLDEGPVLLTLDSHGDVVLRPLREPVPPCGVVASGAGPGIHEALLGLRGAPGRGRHGPSGGGV